MMGSCFAKPINQRSRDKVSLAQLPQLLSQLPPDAEPSRDGSGAYTQHPRGISAAYHPSEKATPENPSPRVQKRSPVRRVVFHVRISCVLRMSLGTQIVEVAAIKSGEKQRD
jgi:hypothetical protein